VPAGAKAYLEQKVWLPHGPVFLSFNVWGSRDPVDLSVCIVDRQGVEHVVETFDPRPKVDRQSNKKPGKKVVDLKGFAGRTVTLRFRATSHHDNGTAAFLGQIRISASDR
jgi:hypothetical protein